MIYMAARALVMIIYDGVGDAMIEDMKNQFNYKGEGENMKRHFDDMMRKGIIRLVNREYIGRASDGVDVLLGTVGNEHAMMIYLVSHPSPSDW